MELLSCLRMGDRARDDGYDLRLVLIRFLLGFRAPPLPSHNNMDQYFPSSIVATSPGQEPGCQIHFLSHFTPDNIRR